MFTNNGNEISIRGFIGLFLGAIGFFATMLVLVAMLRFFFVA